MLFESKKVRSEFFLLFFDDVELKTVLKPTAENFNSEIMTKMRLHFCDPDAIEMFLRSTSSNRRSIVVETSATCVTKC